MKRVKSRLLAGILSVAMAFSVVAVPIEALAATDTNGHWAESTINSWINSGYISGYPDGTFRPNNAISRAEFVTIANKAFGFTSSQGISFNDVKPGYWAYSEIQKGVAAGYIQGDTIGTFRPGSAVSRQEAAVMLANLRGYASDEGAAYNYTDRWAMANWAAGAIGAVSRNGVMSGYPDGTFRPQQALTRAEAVASLQKIATSSNSFDTSINNNNYTPPVYVTPSSNNSTYNNTTSNDDTFTGTILEGTRLENRTLTKDLLIPHSVGSQNITLKNIRMKGTLYVEGGNTITLDNCNIGTVVMNKSNAVLKNNGSSDVDEVRFEEKGRIDGKGYMNVLIDDDTVSEIIIDADIDTLTLDADVDLKLYANANIDTFEITKNADTARIRIGEDAEVMEMEVYDKVRISGKGKIDTMTVYVSGVRSEIQPRRLIQQDNARKPNFNYKDDDDDDDDYDNLTLDDDDEKFDGDDEKYNRVKIAAEDVTVKNLTAYDDLTITSAAGDSTIELEGVTVKGNVYIDGGGDNSVIFDNCSISGSIYSRKSTSGRYDEAVAIKLRDTSVRGDIYVTGDTILESDEKLNKVVLNKELSKTFRMDADANNLVINYNNDVQIRGSRTINAVEVVAGLTNVTITMNGGKFNTLTTRSPIKLEGTGTIDKLFTGQTNDISSGITIGSTETIEGGTQPPSSNYVITSSVSGANGTITPLGQQTVAGGTTKEFNITANTGYHVASIVINGSQVNLDGKLYQTYKYTFYNVSSNHDIIVSFEAGAGTDGNGNASNGSNNGDVNTGDYIISATPGTNGSVDNVMVSVKSGEDASVKFIAEKDYHISEIIIDKDTEDEKSLRRISESTETYKQVTYTFKNVTKNHTIHAVFDVGEGINEIGISSDDPDDPTVKPSGYKYEIKTRLVNERTGKDLKTNDENRYYCIAGDTVGLRITDFITDDPNKEYLQTKWVVVNNTADMEMDLTQKDGETAATLQTKKGSGYAAIVKVQVYDTSDESNVSMPIASSEVAELHVDVPLEDFNLSVLNTTTNQYMLSPQNFIFSPANASAANNKENIEWEVVSFDIEKVGGSLSPGDTETTAEIVNISDGKNGTIPSVRVEQYYKESESSQDEKLVQQPIGTVKIEATIPNGYGNLENARQEFTINFIGTKVVPVTRIAINGTDKQEPKQAQGIQDVDLTKIVTTVYPGDATYKSVEWQIIEPTDGSLGKIKQDRNNKNTILETSGRPGQLKLQPYIKSGKGTEDFIADADEYITVNVTPIAPTVRANSINGSGGTDAGDKITLSAEVTNANRTPYTEIKGWQKTEKTYRDSETPQEGDWVDAKIEGLTKLDDGSYTAQYIVDATKDLNQDSHYTGKTVYFRAIGEYEIYSGANIIKQSVHSNTVSVVCKAESIQFPGKTDSDQDIDSKVTGNNRVYTISGYDTVTLPATLPNQPDKTITWGFDGTAPAEGVAKLDGNILTVKGKPNETFTLSGEVTGKGPTKFKVQTAFVAIDKKSSSMSVVDKDGVAISSVNTNDEVDLNRMTINPKNASYFSNPTVTWRISETKESTGESIETQSGKYVIPDKYKGKTIYFYVAWQNGIMDGDNSAPLVSNPYEIKVNDDAIEPVTGISFDGMNVGTFGGGTDNKYTWTIPSISEQTIINLSMAKVIPDKASNTEILWTAPAGSSIDSKIATLDQNILTIPDNTIGGTITLNARVENGKGAGQDYTATLTLTIPEGTTTTSIDSSPTNIQSPSAGEASIGVISENTTTNENNTTNTNTENQNNITAVTDIAFSDIKGLQAPIAPATTYNMTSSSNENIVLYLADNKNTVNGITTHTGVKVLPENATYKNVTWKVKEGALLAPSTVDNIVNVTGIGSLNQNTNTFTVNANASGTVTLVATIANGKGQNNNFVKELTIRITAPNNASQSSVVPSDTTSSNETSSSANMTKASARQVVSVGTTQVGTSSISSASGSQTSQSSTKNTTTSIINHSEVKIETSGQCRKNISIPLKAVSKTTQQEYTDVEWEIVDDGNTGAKISNKNRLRASKTGTVTVKATVYTPSNEKMECSTNIVISN